MVFAFGARDANTNPVVLAERSSPNRHAKSVRRFTAVRSLQPGCIERGVRHFPPGRNPAQRAKRYIAASWCSSKHCQSACTPRNDGPRTHTVFSAAWAAWQLRSVEPDAPERSAGAQAPTPPVDRARAGMRCGRGQLLTRSYTLRRARDVLIGPGEPEFALRTRLARHSTARANGRRPGQAGCFDRWKSLGS